MKKFWRWLCAFTGCVIFTSCSVDSCSSMTQERNTGLKIACWNVQTFFDGKTSGCEYQDFKNSEYWNEERYKQRLSRLCEFITTTNADLFVFEELENSGVLIDVYNQLSGASWNSSNLWLYGMFAKQADSAIGTGILSKFPLEDLRIHDMDIRTQQEKQPSGRPIVEVTVIVEGEKLKLFANHWKSKASGVGNGEIWRNWQECILTNEIIRTSSDVLSNEPSQKFIVCGDFNRDILNFTSGEIEGQHRIHLRGINSPKDVSFASVKSSWISETGDLIESSGSYYYKGNWERIDHFFFGDDINFSDFRVMDDIPWATEEGLPNGYKIYTGEGYSDHLPLICNIFFQQK